MPITIPTTNGPIVMYEMWDSFRKGIDLGKGPWVTQNYVLSAADWKNTDAVCNALMGSTTSVGGVGGTIIRIPGFACPTSPDLTCVNAECTGEGERGLYDGGHVEFNLPLIHVEYGIRTYDQSASDDPGGQNSFVNDDNPGQPYTFAEMSVDYAVEVLKVPTSAYQFLGPMLPADLPMTQRIGVARLSFVRKRVPWLPYLTILNLVGSINDNAPMWGAGRGKLLFAGARTDKVWDSDSQTLQDIALEFHYRQYDWNYFPRPDTGAFDFVYNKTTSAGIYNYADLRPLLSS